MALQLPYYKSAAFRYINLAIGPNISLFEATLGARNLAHRKTTMVVGEHENQWQVGKSLPRRRCKWPCSAPRFANDVWRLRK